MSTQEILAQLPRLSVEERAEVAQALYNLTASEAVTESSPVAPLPQANMHEGAWVVADDFDEPLPDEFWLGDDA